MTMQLPTPLYICHGICSPPMLVEEHAVLEETRLTSAMLGCRNDITSKMHPESGTDPKNAGVRDDLWAFFMAAASMLSPTDPLKLLEEQWNR